MSFISSIRPVVFIVIVQCLFGCATNAGSSNATGEQRWYRILAPENKKIGYRSTTIEQREADRTVTDVLRVTTRQKGLPVVEVEVTLVYREDRNGDPIYVERRETISRLSTVVRGTIRDNEIDIDAKTSVDRHRKTYAVPDNTRFDGGAGLIASWDPHRQPVLEFEQFDLQSLAVQQVRLEHLTDTLLVPVTQIEVRRIVARNGRTLSVTRERYDAGMQLVSAEVMSGNLPLTIEHADKDTALQTNKPYDTLRHLAIKSPYKIGKLALGGHIRYTFTFENDEVFRLPQTPNQRVRLEGNQMIVDVCETCGSAEEFDAADINAARQPTRWLQSEHPRVRKMANRIAHGRLSDERKMRRFEAAVEKRLTVIEFVGHASALEALVNRRGDCTEYAALLAALGRAAGIPTRVMTGLVYSRARYHGVSNVFIPHAWVQAWVDGEWRNFDAALGGFDASHIAFTIGDGRPDEIAEANRLNSLLIWEDMAQIKR